MVKVWVEVQVLVVEGPAAAAGADAEGDAGGGRAGGAGAAAVLVREAAVLGALARHEVAVAGRMEVVFGVGHCGCGGGEEGAAEQEQRREGR